MLPADLSARDIDAIGNEKIEDVAQNADTVLTVHFDAHGGSTLVNRPLFCNGAKFIVKNT
jgi:hypothetical protein